MNYQNSAFAQARDTTNKQELIEELRQWPRFTFRVTVTYAVDYDRRTALSSES